jgi:hypothetical protein
VTNGVLVEESGSNARQGNERFFFFKRKITKA